MLSIEGKVLVTKPEQAPAPAQPNMSLAVRDRLGTGRRSRALLQMSERWLARVDQMTDIEITPGAIGARGKDAVSVALGGISVYSREEEGELKIVTPAATGGLRGTQLVARVYSDGRTVMQVLEGEVDLFNDHGHLLLRSGEAGEAERDSAPRRTAAIETQNLLQWTLYYPAILTPEEFALSSDEQREIAVSLGAYRQGDLLAALDQLPATLTSSSPGLSLYRAAVLLATGRVDDARQVLDDVPAENPGRRSLERMIAAVQYREQPAWPEPATAGEAMAESYYRQSRSELPLARGAARRATELAPQSGFAWTRLAELEFSFGDTHAAIAALDRGVAATPRNAQAHALHGFLLSADNRLAAARTEFETALAIDGGLGNAWLGLGLIKIKQRDAAGGRADLQTAATAEPTRSSFYSYHGKALSNQGLDALAAKDLALAKKNDPRDPTPWLYGSILSQQGNRYNEAIGEMAESLRLNDNRQVYRSRFLLDQDRAVRNTNLALIYQHNGMADLSLREATRAVERDYSNASAHLFLANSYDALRDPERLLLRYETAWFNELLVANLLSPVGGGPLSQYVSQQEYSRLLESDGVGGSVVADVRDDGYINVQASLFGTKGRFSTGVDYLYHEDDGTRANNDNRHQELYWQAKFQASPSDVLYALVKWDRQEAGDLSLNTDNTPGSPSVRYEIEQDPGLALVAWSHRWAPGVHTLFLGGRLAGEQKQTQADYRSPLLLRSSAAWQPGFLQAGAAGGLEYVAPELRNATTPPVSVSPQGWMVLSPDFQRLIAPHLGQGVAPAYAIGEFNLAAQLKFEIYSAELQQIWQTGGQTFVAGLRYQDGEFEAQDMLTATAVSPFYTSPAARHDVTTDFGRRSVYAYDFLAVTSKLTLIAGATWDWLERPENFRMPPVSDRSVETERFSGKLGFTYAPGPILTLRGLYAEAQGGVTFDESVRLEPVQLAGFNQAFRTVISEALAGSVEAPVYKTLGFSAEGALPHRTWWSVTFNRLDEDVERVTGAFDFLVASIFPFPGFAFLPAGTAEVLDYRETDWLAGVNHLIGDQFAVGLNYRHTQAELNRAFPDISPSANLNSADEATLQELTFQLRWNSPKGWFALAEANWFDQHANGNSAGATTADRFEQINLQLGHRFRRNQCEVSAGVLNLTDTDYRLNPLTYTRALPRERTFFARCRFGF